MKTQLFIEGYEIELDESVQFLINKQFEELSNPTVIINDWSKTVSIPMTVNNNKIFGYIYRPEQIIVNDGTDDSYKQMGMYFDPTKKLDFRLIYNSIEIMTGYAKMNEIKQNKGKGTYDVTLFGQLGKILQEMKKITFDNSTTDTDYLINGSEYVEEKINKSLVYNSWTSSGQTHEELYPKYFIPAGSSYPVTHPAYNVTDIIGFAPNNSFSDDFKYDTYQSGSNESNTFENELGSGFTVATGVEPKTVIPNGYLPREIGEYRSYHQLPFIYWNKLFKIFQAKAESITGYQFELNSSWFSTTNPYWYNLVYMLKPFETKDNKDGAINYYDMGITDRNTSWSGSGWSTEKSGEMYAISTSVQTYNLLNMFGWGNTAKFQLSKSYSLFCTFNLGFELKADLHDSSDDPCYFSPTNALVITIELLGSDNNVKKSSTVIVHRGDYSGSTSGYDEDIIYSNKATKEGNYNYFRINPQFKYYVNRGEFGSSFYFRIKAKWINDTTPLVFNNYLEYLGNLSFKEYSACTLQTQITAGKKSNSYFTLNDLWNNDYNVFDEIIRYCKMYRISISVDELNKKIIFQPFNKYFENYTIEDWTDKIDKSKDYTITPITFENKYILFDYKDSDTQLGKAYKEKYGVNYGEYRLITDYNFNTETKKLFENCPQSIVNTDNVLSWKNLKNNQKIVYSFPAEIYVYNKDKDNKQKDIFGSFYFHNGLKYFDTEAKLNLVTVKIADDTDFQLANNTYFYNRSGGNRQLVYTYPFLDIVSGDNMCVFNIPKENYTYNSNYTRKQTIYTNFWEKYINERYNIQNKKVTCYLKLTSKDWIDFEFNHFIKIDGILYIVNKIYDYNIESSDTVKVDLITISDINGYIS